MPPETEVRYTEGIMKLQPTVKPLPLLALIIITAGLPLALAACGSLQPTPTPVLLTAEEVLALSREQIEEVKTLRIGVSGKFQQGDVTFPFKMDGDVTSPCWMNFLAFRE